MAGEFQSSGQRIMLVEDYGRVRELLAEARMTASPGLQAPIEGLELWQAYLNSMGYCT